MANHLVDNMEDFEAIVERKKMGICKKNNLQRFHVKEHKGCEHDPKKIKYDEIGKHIEEINKGKKNTLRCVYDPYLDEKNLEKVVEKHRRILKGIAIRTSIANRRLFGTLHNPRILETLNKIKLMKKKRWRR